MHRPLHRPFLPVLLLAALTGCSEGAAEIVWPLSGTESPDLPIGSTFGPRLVSTSDYGYDFHPGLDIPADTGTPVHAIAAGQVFRAGEYEWYSAPIVLIRHCPDTSQLDCYESDAWYTLYHHLSEVDVAEDDLVSAGDVVGLSGASDSGYEHLHVEVREGGYQSEDAVHPMSWLPYDNKGEIAINIDDVDQSDPGSPVVTVSLSLHAEEPDLEAVSITLSSAAGRSSALDTQTLDLNAWNATYGDDDDIEEDDLEGVLMAPAIFNSRSSTYELSLTFHDLTDESEGEDLQIEVTATDARGESFSANYTP